MEHLKRAVATLAYLWGNTSEEVCERLRIGIDLGSLPPIPIGKRARRALQSQNAKYKTKRMPKRKQSAPIQRTIELLDNSRFFYDLWKQLLHIAKKKIRNLEDAKDQVATALQRIIYIKAETHDELVKKAKVILRYIIRDYYSRKYKLNFIETSIQDFYVIEEQEGLLDCNEDEERADVITTESIDESFCRVAMELVKLLGWKHAAAVCGMREKTFRRHIEAHIKKIIAYPKH